MITYPSTLKYILTSHNHHFIEWLFVCCLLSSDKLNISCKFRMRMKQPKWQVLTSSSYCTNCRHHKILFHISRCIFITTPFRLNRHSCLLSESGNASFRSYVQTTCISNWLIWKQKVCKTFLSSSRNISIIIVTQNSLKMVSWPIFWTKSVTL